MEMAIHIEPVLGNGRHGGLPGHEHLPEVLIVVPLLGELACHANDGQRLHCGNRKLFCQQSGEEAMKKSDMTLSSGYGKSPRRYISERAVYSTSGTSSKAGLMIQLEQLCDNKSTYEASRVHLITPVVYPIHSRMKRKNMACNYNTIFTKAPTLIRHCLVVGVYFGAYRGRSGYEA